MLPERHAFWELYPNAFGWSRIFVYGLAVLTMAVFGYGLYRRIMLWKKGKPVADRLDNLPERISGLIRYGFFQAKIIRQAFAGLFHSVIFWGFAVLFVGTSLTMFDEDLYRLVTGHKLISGSFYIVFSWLLDVAGVLAILGIGMAAFRRYIQKPEPLDSKNEDLVFLGLILAILVTGFFSEALRISNEMNAFETTASPFGYLLATAFAGFGSSTKMAVHAVFWFSHLFLALGFIAFLPHTKGLHILTGWFNVFTRNLGPAGKLASIPNMMERMERDEEVELGYKSIDDLTWKDRLMLDACTRCGRCQDVCPAYATGKHLNPKQVIQDMLALMLTPSSKGKTLLEAEGGKEKGAISSEVLWDCTTCMACMNACPVMIEHIPLILQMRRELAMEFDDMSTECRTLFKNMDVNANPWGMNPAARFEWAKDAGVPTVFDNPDFEYLIFGGCLGAYDERTQRICQSLIKILNAASISYAILGEMELCCGDPIRRLGNEASFQALVGMTAETLKDAEVTIRKVITICPHCYNTLAHEYPEFGFDWEVVHHSVLIAELIAQGRIKLKAGDPMTAVLHDSCYLARYNSIVEPPRQIASALNVQLAPLALSGADGFCCGGGGGRTWLEEEVEDVEDKINLRRITQLAGTGAKTVLSACPYCMMMFEEAAKLKKIKKGGDLWRAHGVDQTDQSDREDLDLFELVKLKDLAELVAERLEEKEG